MNVYEAAQQLAISVELTLYLLERLGFRRRDRLDPVRPDELTAADDVLNGIGAVFPWRAQEQVRDAISGIDYRASSALRSTGTPRLPGESMRRWIVRSLENYRMERMRPKEAPVVVQRRTGRVLAPSAPTSATRSADHGGSFMTAPAPIRYPLLVHGGTRLRVEITQQQATALMLSNRDADHLPWETFDLVIVGGLGWLASIRCVRSRVEAVTSTGDVVVEAADIFEPQRKMVESIVYGLCVLVAEAPPGKGGRAKRGGSVEPAFDALTRSKSHPIVLDVGQEMVATAAELLSSSTPDLPRRIGVSVLVRGHHCRQRCGPGNQEVKVIWRRPHYSPRLGLARSKQTYEVRA